MNSLSHVKEQIALDRPVTQLTLLRGRSQEQRSVSVDSVSYHLFKPRSARHPLLAAAYELWRDGWQAALAELEGAVKMHSDEFGRQDEIGVLCVDGCCVSITGLRWFDLGLAMAREDSYFSNWPRDSLSQLGPRLVGIPSNLIVHSEWRRTLIEPRSENVGTPVTLAFASLALAIRRFVDSPAERFIGVARNDRSMNRVAAAIGGTKIGQTTVHGIDSDLICITRDDARPEGAIADTLWERRHHQQ